jgi:3'-phosphoadenosine 5'-phosphosulfate sulfotransferase (PAPS reductase)/FAD synthetase
MATSHLSAALAIYLKQKNKVPDIEYFFTDTGVELPEIYTFLDKLDTF